VNNFDKDKSSGGYEIPDIVITIRPIEKWEMLMVVSTEIVFSIGP